jgi:hypothetical protein
VGHVNNGQCVLVIIEADLVALKLSVGTGVDHALGVVGVSIRGIATCVRVKESQRNTKVNKR